MLQGARVWCRHRPRRGRGGREAAARAAETAEAEARARRDAEQKELEKPTESFQHHTRAGRTL